MKGLLYLLPFVPALALFALWLAGASLDLGPDWPLVQFVETLLWFLLSGILVALAVIVALGFLWLRRTGALDAWRAERKFHRTGLLGDVVTVALRRNEMPDIRGRLAGRNDRATELARCELALSEACAAYLQLGASVRLHPTGPLRNDTLAIMESAVKSLAASADRLGSFARHPLVPSDEIESRLVGERERLESLRLAMLQCQHSLAELVLVTESDIDDVSKRFAAVRIAANTLAEWRGA